MWYLYILQCKDGSYYIGVTINIRQRLDRHNSGKGAKYTRSKRPCELVYFEECDNEVKARSREHELKKWRRDAKERLVSGFLSSALSRILRISGQ